MQYGLTWAVLLDESSDILTLPTAPLARGRKEIDILAWGWTSRSRGPFHRGR
jgi:hypothetical protein